MITRTALMMLVAGAATGANGQLLNPDFETPGVSTTFADWTEYGNSANILADTSELLNGFASLKMFGDFFVDFNTKGVFQNSSASVTPGDEWEVSALVGDITGDQIAGQNFGFVSLVYTDANGNNLLDLGTNIDVNSVVTDQLTRFASSRVAPLAATGVQINLGFQQPVITDGGALHYDDAEVNLISSGNDIPFYNGGFEELLFGRAVEAWVDFGNSIPNIFTSEFFTNPPAVEGQQSVLMFGQFNGDPEGNDSGIFQALPASAGEQWTAAVSVYNDPGDPISGANVAILSLVFRDAGGAVLAEAPVTAADSGTATGVWTPVSSSATAPANTATAEIVLVYSQAPAESDLNGDGSIGAGDEPTGLVRWDDSSLEIGAAARLCADQNQDGLVTPSDFTAWVLNFNTSNPLADTNQDTLVTPADFTGWVLAFNQGANGPTCNP
ncbi:MAG: hypothetical protein AAFR96_06265 [Planctomycetota bacterium]